jgi:hypothetical protein
MREAAAALVLLMLAGCATAPRVIPPTERQVAVPPGVAKAHLVERLLALGFKVTGAERIHGEAAVADPSWADCPTVITHASNNSNQSDFAHAGARQAVVEATTTPTDAGTTVQVSARFSGTYLNHFKNLPFKGACDSTGVLESTLLDAAG